MMSVVPYKDESAGKKDQVARMFETISARYDFLNHLMSLGIDRSWRRKAIRMLRDGQPKYILDVATGTGDFAIQALSLNPDKVVGIDISEGMLNKGRAKLAEGRLGERSELLKGDREIIPLEGNKFAAVPVAFGVGTLETREWSLQEINGG